MDFKDDYQQKEEAVSVNQNQEQSVQQNSYVEDQSEQGLEEAAWAAKVQGGKEQANKTGIPDALKTKLEQEFGFDLSKVRVHYNASIPPELNALAYAKGLDVYISKGNEKHLEHELRHVVQQMKGEAKATEIINSEKVDTRDSMEGKADINTTTDNSAPLKNLQESTPSGDIVQRQVITEEAALAKMEIVGGDFKGVSQIKTPYGNDPEATNCHGYTINQAVDNWIDGDQLSSKIPADSATKIAVFVKNGKVAHSGIYDGNKLTHFLIGVGVVESTIALDGLAGYDNRYNLPDDREALESFITEATAAAVAEAAIEERIDTVDQILGYAQDYSSDIQTNLSLKTYLDERDQTKKLAYITSNLQEINKVRVALNAFIGNDDYSDEIK